MVDLPYRLQPGLGACGPRLMTALLGSPAPIAHKQLPLTATSTYAPLLSLCFYTMPTSTWHSKKWLKTIKCLNLKVGFLKKKKWVTGKLEKKFVVAGGGSSARTACRSPRVPARLRLSPPGYGCPHRAVLAACRPSTGRQPRLPLPGSATRPARLPGARRARSRRQTLTRSRGRSPRAMPPLPTAVPRSESGPSRHRQPAPCPRRARPMLVNTAEPAPGRLHPPVLPAGARGVEKQPWAGASASEWYCGYGTDSSARWQPRALCAEPRSVTGRQGHAGFFRVLWAPRSPRGS